jgi:pyrimidine-nucleoside phosphorylase
VEAQGGDPRAIDDPARLPAARRKIELKSTSDGFVQSLEARPVGHATMLLGAGRARMDSTIDPAVGVILHKKSGSNVRVGEPLCTVLVNDESRLDEALGLIKAAFQIGPGPVALPSLVVERISSSPVGLRSGPPAGVAVIDRPA